MKRRWTFGSLAAAGHDFRLAGRTLSRSLFAAVLAALAAQGTAKEISIPDIPGAYEFDNSRHAILIGVEKYRHLPALRFTANDVHVLADTLIERGHFRFDQVQRFCDDALQPTREHLMRMIPQRLGNLDEQATVLIYFSGHGYRDRDGKMYLCPSDCDPEHPAETGIPATWLRQELAACKASFKLLVLDACHAGAETGDDESPSAKDLGETFRDLTGVVTLASSTGDEKSLLWEEKSQSLFSYWLTQGLRGHADENGDSQLDVDELNKYVHRNVTQVAKSRFGRSQTPVRIVRSGAPGVPVVIQLRPLGLQEVLSDMADQLAWTIDDRKLNNVAVLEFSADTPLGELLGVDFGLLGKYCSTKLEQRLTGMSYNRYTVVDARRLTKALEELAFTIDDLASDARLDDLAQRVGAVPMLALGTLRSRAGRAVTLQCKLVDAKTGGMAAAVGGSALLTPSEWAMLGRSVHRKPRPQNLDPAPDGPQPDEIERLDDESQGPHPLSDPRFPFPVKILIGGRERKGVFHGNDYYVPVRRGEVYAIQVECRQQQPALLRLLVDGLNTLPEKIVEKGVTVEEVAPRVNLDTARHWILDPRQQRSRKWLVAGFVTQTGRQGRLREFKIVDLEESVAARQQFTEQIGLITAAFYDPKPELPTFAGAFDVGAAPGTGFGDEVEGRLETRRGPELGELRAVVHIRYVDADALAAMQEEWAAQAQ